jgi:hypothetical protein
MFVNSDFSDLLRIMGRSAKHKVKLPKFQKLRKFLILVEPGFGKNVRA